MIRFYELDLKHDADDAVVCIYCIDSESQYALREYWFDVWVILLIVVRTKKRARVNSPLSVSLRIYFQVILPSPVIGKDVSPQHLTPPSLMSAQPIYSPDPMASTPSVSPRASTGLLEKYVLSPNWPK